MKTLLFLIFCITFSLAGNSQTIVIKDLRSLSDQLTYQRSRGETNYNNIEGTPFLNQKFIPGEVVVNDSIRYENVPLRYNMYSDKIEFQNNQKQVLELGDFKSIFKIHFGNHLFVFHDYLNYGKQTSGILEQLVDGRIQLYKKYQVELKPAEKAIGYKDAEPNRFVRQDDRYLLATGKERPKAIGNKKSLFEKLQQSKPDIEKYAKKHKLNPKNKEDLIQLIRYCNNE